MLKEKKAAKIKGLMEKGDLGAGRDDGAGRAEKRMPEAVSTRGAGADVAGLKTGGCLQCPRLLQTAACAHHPGCRVKTLLICSWSVGRDAGRDGQRCADTKPVSEIGVRESLRHARSNRKKHTHTYPGDRKARRQEGRGGNQRRKWEEEKGRRWVKKERSQDVGGRGRGLASNTRRAPGRDLSTRRLVFPAGGPSGAEVGESFLPKAMS